MNQNVHAEGFSYARLSYSEIFLALALVSFYLEGSIRKWVLLPNSMWMEPVALSKAGFVFIAVLLTSRIDHGTDLDRFRKWIIGIPLLLILLGSVISASTAYHTVGSILTVFILTAIPYISTWVPRSLTANGIRLCLFCCSFLMVGMLPLVIIQYTSDRFDVINCYVGGVNEFVATTGFNDRVRATGTFSYISGLSVGSLLGEAAGIYLYLYSRTTKGRLWATVTIISSVICGFATVSRGTMIALSAIFMGWAILAKGSRPKVIVSSFFIIFMALAYFNVGGVQQILVAVFERSKTVDDTYTDRIVGLFAELLNQLDKNPLGGGLGTTQNVAGGFYSAGVETEFGRLVFEVGAIGFLGYLFTYWGAVYWLFVSSLRVSNLLSRSISICCCVTCALLLVVGVIFNHVALSAFWATFSAGAFLLDNPAFARSLPQRFLGRTQSLVE